MYRYIYACLLVNCIVGGVLFLQLITCVPVGGGAPMRGEAAGSAAATMRGGGAGRGGARCGAAYRRPSSGFYRRRLAAGAEWEVDSHSPVDEGCVGRSSFWEGGACGARGQGGQLRWCTSCGRRKDQGEHD
jgi:hypothetical protein